MPLVSLLVQQKLLVALHRSKFLDGCGTNFLDLRHFPTRLVLFLFFFPFLLLLLLLVGVFLTNVQEQGFDPRVTLFVRFCAENMAHDVVRVLAGIGNRLPLLGLENKECMAVRVGVSTLLAIIGVVGFFLRLLASNLGVGQ